MSRSVGTLVGYISAPIRPPGQRYIAGVLPGIVGDGPRKRVVVAHLGNGSSMCAMRDGMSVATTMRSGLVGALT